MWNHERLRVWRRALSLAVAVYEESARWPSIETFGLVSQARRAAVSIGANIAEGAGRSTHRAYAQFVGHAIGSSNELGHLLTVAKDVAMGDGPSIATLIDENRAITKMLHALRKSILEAVPPLHRRATGNS